jgi:hypothetical protein
VSEIWCYGYAEDALSCAVMRRLVQHQNENATTGIYIRFNPGFPEDKKGCGNLKKIIPKICKMAEAGIYTLVLTDLDAIECAPALIRKWFNLDNKKPQVPENMIFRIAEREVETWLLADREGIASFLEIAPANFSLNPDSLPDPKQHILNVLRSKGRKRYHREMLPGKYSAIGSEYNPKLCEFVNNHWNIQRAQTSSKSLRRAIDSLLSI